MASETKTVWHKYPDEKPPEDCELLVTVKSDYGGESWIDVSGRAFGDFIVELDGGQSHHVIAWAELPEPFSPEDDYGS